MTRITDEQLAELAQLAREATPGPWFVNGEDFEGDGGAGVSIGIGDGPALIFVTRNTDRGKPDHAQPLDFADAAHIAAANPATVAALVAEVARLRAALAPFAAVHCANFMDDEGGSCPANDVVPEHWCEYCNARAALGGAE